MSKNQIGSKNPNYVGNTVTCLVCGKQFKSQLSHKRKYCSSQCYGKVSPNKKLKQEGLESFLRQLYLVEKISAKEIASKLNCDPQTVSYWLRKFGIPIRSLSESAKITYANRSPEAKKKFNGTSRIRVYSPEERANRSQRAKNLWVNPEMRELLRRKISTGLMGNKYRKGTPHSKEIKQKIANTVKKHWKDPVYAKKVLTALQEEPNKSEKKLQRIMEENNFPFRYVGDGQVIIDGQIPDFVATDGSKKLIELFGEPWHDSNHSNKIIVKPARTVGAKQQFYTTHGYALLIIWDKELRDEEKVINRIKDFLHTDLCGVEKPVGNPVPPAQ